MQPYNLILIVAMLCTRQVCSSPMPIGEAEHDLADTVGLSFDDVEDNQSDGTETTLEMFDNLRDLIEESRDAIIVHIDEKIDTLKRDIILNDDNEFVLADDNSEIIGDEGGADICFPAGEEPVCGEFGECVRSEEREGFTCLCEHGYTGDTCQLVDHCAEISCLNDGECINNREGFECDCTDGWYGEHCEKDAE